MTRFEVTCRGYVSRLQVTGDWLQVASKPASPLAVLPPEDRDIADPALPRP